MDDEVLKARIEEIKSDLTFMIRYKELLLKERWYSEQEFWHAVDEALDELSNLLND